MDQPEKVAGVFWDLVDPDVPPMDVGSACNDSRWPSQRFGMLLGGFQYESRGS